MTPDNKKAPEEFLISVIERKSALINSHLDGQYILPIDLEASPIGAQILRDICIDCSRDAIAIKLQVATESVDQTSAAPQPPRRKSPYTLLKMIQEGTMSLVDVPRCPSCNAVSIGFSTEDESDFDLAHRGGDDYSQFRRF